MIESHLYGMAPIKRQIYLQSGETVVRWFQKSKKILFYKFNDTLVGVVKIALAVFFCYLLFFACPIIEYERNLKNESLHDICVEYNICFDNGQELLHSMQSSTNFSYHSKYLIKWRMAIFGELEQPVKVDDAEKKKPLFTDQRIEKMFPSSAVQLYKTIFDWEKEYPTKIIRHRGGVGRLQLSPDGKYFFIYLDNI